jgi:hypothetical protein
MLLAIPLLLCTAGISLSQVAAPPPGRPGGPPPDDARTRMWLFENMVKYLKLDDSASKRFQPIFLDYSEKRGRLMREHFEVTHKIFKAVDNDASPIAEMQTLTQRYKVLNRSLWQEKERFLKRSEEVLDARQMVKLTIYEDKMKEELFRRLKRGNQQTPGSMTLTPPAPSR